MPEVSELFIYPVKSLGGISLSSSPVTGRGLQFDRRWMLVDKNNQFMTQRTFPQMALLKTAISANCLKISCSKNTDSFEIPFITEGEIINVVVWEDQCLAQLVSKEADRWFSEMLSTDCRLVYMPDETKRSVDTGYAHRNEITAFSDGFPLLIIGQSSLDDLNSRLSQPLPINRFRPNIVFTGGEPYEEDWWEHFSINELQFYGVKLCSRCVITAINQQDASKGKEPLKTLATYREWNNKIYFGQNLLHEGEGIIKVGEVINVKRKGPEKKFNALN
jgi:uncharacterized protein YcbX